MGKKRRPLPAGLSVESLMSSTLLKRPDSPPARISLTGVAKSFGGRQVLRNITLEIPAGRLTFLVGRSGAGKSVLSRCSVGLLRADKGSIRIGGEEITDMSEAELMKLRHRVPYVIQESALIDWLTLEENAALPLSRSPTVSLPRREALAEARRILGEVGLCGQENKKPQEASAGDRKLAAIARALVLSPAAIFYDEPTTGLDPDAARRVDGLIRRRRDEGATSVVVSHDLNSIRRIADEVALLEDGVIAFHGPAADFLAPDAPNAAVHRFFHQAET